MPQDNSVLNKALQAPVPAKKENPDLAKIDNQKSEKVEDIGLPTQAMELLDKSMSELSETKDLNGSIKNIITKLQGLVKEEEVEKPKRFTRKELSTY
jgi:hypothetical protein